MEKVFAPAILDGSMEDELVAFTWFSENLLFIAKDIKPMNTHGPQCGDYQMLKHYGETIVKIAENALKERERY